MDDSLVSCFFDLRCIVFAYYLFNFYRASSICYGPVSVCLSVTGRYFVKTANHGITQIMSHDIPRTLVF